ncbi:hypothetical protein [Streptomyces sp. NPDC088736]|uniref:hypothetical protein n=1 Tax=Streptomyces sp. NPDC088736 TaxID=3365881 RepID=UPI0037F5789F
MARYEIKYLIGDSEIIEARNLEPSGSQYIGWRTDGSAAAYIPIANVLSVVRLADEDASNGASN